MDIRTASTLSCVALSVLLGACATSPATRSTTPRQTHNTVSKTDDPITTDTAAVTSNAWDDVAPDRNETADTGTPQTTVTVTDDHAEVEITDPSTTVSPEAAERQTNTDSSTAPESVARAVTTPQAAETGTTTAPVPIPTPVPQHGLKDVDALVTAPTTQPVTPPNPVPMTETQTSATKPDSLPESEPTTTAQAKDDRIDARPMHEGSKTIPPAEQATETQSSPSAQPTPTPLTVTEQTELYQQLRADIRQGKVEQAQTRIAKQRAAIVEHDSEAGHAAFADLQMMQGTIEALMRHRKVTQTQR